MYLRMRTSGNNSKSRITATNKGKLLEKTKCKNEIPQVKSKSESPEEKRKREIHNGTEKSRRAGISSAFDDLGDILFGPGKFRVKPRTRLTKSQILKAAFEYLTEEVPAIIALEKEVKKEYEKYVLRCIKNEDVPKPYEECHLDQD